MQRVDCFAGVANLIRPPLPAVAVVYVPGHPATHPEGILSNDWIAKCGGGLFFWGGRKRKKTAADALFG